MRIKNGCLYVQFFCLYYVTWMYKLIKTFIFFIEEYSLKYNNMKDY